MDRGNVYLGSETNARKVKNLQSNSRAAIVFDAYRDSWNGLRGVMLQCRARVVEEKEFKTVRRKLYAKYPKYGTDATLEPGESVIIELVPEQKSRWPLYMGCTPYTVHIVRTFRRTGKCPKCMATYISPEQRAKDPLE